MLHICHLSLFSSYSAALKISDKIPLTSCNEVIEKSLSLSDGLLLVILRSRYGLWAWEVELSTFTNKVRF